MSDKKFIPFIDWWGDEFHGAGQSKIGCTFLYRKNPETNWYDIEFYIPNKRGEGHYLKHTVSTKEYKDINRTACSSLSEYCAYSHINLKKEYGIE